MSIKPEVKQDLITEYAINEKDTGSVDVQCAILTTRILNLTAHLKENPKDYSSQRGLLILVGRRNRLLKYAKKKNISKYLDLTNKLGLRRKK
jgi:small subunit ribosomal protein S15